MNQSSAFSEQLQREPVPSSPASLDQKILAYSREQVPRKIPWHISPWVSVAATCSVMGVAMLLVLKTSMPFTFENNQPFYEPAAGGVEAMPVKLKSPSIQTGDKTEEDELMVEMPKASLARLRVLAPDSPDQRSSKRRSAFAANQESKAPLRAMRISVQDNAVVSNLEAVKPPGAPRDHGITIAAVEIVRGALLVNSQENVRDIEEVVVGTVKSLAESNIAAARPPGIVEGIETDEVLQKLRFLLENGKIENARSGYQQLVKRCGQCELPETLELALKELGARQALEQKSL